MEKEIKLKKKELHLANERTFLSYVRTAASIFVLAIALIRFFDNRFLIILGFLFVLIGAFIFVLGAYRYHQERKQILTDAV
jgi:uncharacterized membrane protein YidH (DUF202 family)